MKHAIAAKAIAAPSSSVTLCTAGGFIMIAGLIGMTIDRAAVQRPSFADGWTLRGAVETAPVSAPPRG